MRTLARILEAETETETGTSLNVLQTRALLGVIIFIIFLVLYGLQCLLNRPCGISSTTCPNTLRNSSTRSSAYKRMLDSLPVVHYTPSSGSEACVICLAEYNEGDAVRVLPRCNHFLHVECINEWLLRSLKCPICRAPVIDHLKVDDDPVIRVSNVSNCPPFISVNVSRPII